MKAQEIKKGVYWVGARDWNVRNFHGYEVKRGTSYNAYLIMDEKITLVDTVKEPFTNELVRRIKSVVDPSKIAYLVCNHVEMDHSGAMPEIMRLAPNATVITDAQGEAALKEHYDISDWKIQIVKTGDTLNIGKRNLSFVQTPMLHWPDSMVTYVAEDRLLLPNDGFGQHIASDNIFASGDDSLDIVFEEAKKYYANILFPFPKQANKALGAVDTLKIDMIAPSHGCIWRGNDEISKIKSLYKKWAAGENDGKAVIIYDTMWGSTEKLAKAVQEELEEHGIPTVLRSLSVNHISDVIVDVLDAKYVIIGTPTLNNQILPTMAAFMTYMKGLAPHSNKVGFVFGSYGWTPGAINSIQETFEHLRWDHSVTPYHVKYVPNGNNEQEIKEKIRELVKC